MTLSTVQSQRDRIQALFDAAAAVRLGDPVQAHLAHFLCIRICGFIERATEEIYSEYARARSQPRVARFVSRRLERVDPRAERLYALAASFDTQWEVELKRVLEPDGRAAINSLVGNRNRIAHGENVSLGLDQLKSWHKRVLDYVSAIEGFTGV